MELAQNSGVPYGRIYDVLNSLVEKKLAKIIPEDSKKFVPGDPAVLKHILEQRKKELEEISEKLSKFKEMYSEKGKENIWITKGRRNFYKSLEQLPWAEKYTYHIKQDAEFHPYWVRCNKKLAREGVEIKQLINPTSENMENIKKWKKAVPTTKMRAFKNEGIAMDISSNYCWIALIHSNTLIVIKDKAFSKLMKTLFLNTYKNAPKI